MHGQQHFGEVVVEGPVLYSGCRFQIFTYRIAVAGRRFIVPFFELNGHVVPVGKARLGSDLIHGLVGGGEEVSRVFAAGEGYQLGEGQTQSILYVS